MERNPGKEAQIWGAPFQTAVDANIGGTNDHMKLHTQLSFMQFKQHELRVRGSFSYRAGEGEETREAAVKQAKIQLKKKDDKTLLIQALMICLFHHNCIGAFNWPKVKAGRSNCFILVVLSFVLHF